jgi:hypothetical protein
MGVRPHLNSTERSAFDAEWAKARAGLEMIGASQDILLICLRIAEEFFAAGLKVHRRPTHTIDRQDGML